MKKIIALILAMLLIFCGCSEKKNPLAQSTGEEALIVPDENPPAKMRVLYADERAITVEIESLSENEIIFSDDFNIQIYENGKWCSLEIIPEHAEFTEPAYPVEPGESREQEISFAWFYGSLMEGKYRIIKSISEEKDEKYSGFRIAAEFAVPFVPMEEEPPEKTDEPEEQEIIPEEGLPEIEPEKPADELKPGQPGSMIIPIPGNSENAEAIEGSIVLRANGAGIGAEETMWHLYAANEQNGKGDSPIMVFTDAQKLESFYMDMEGTYQFGSGDGSAKEKILSYGDDYFEENALIIIHRQTGSGSVRYTVTGVAYYGASCHITVNAQMPEVGTADMADWFILIEQPKADIENCEDFVLSIT